MLIFVKISVTFCGLVAIGMTVVGPSAVSFGIYVLLEIAWFSLHQSRMGFVSMVSVSTRSMAISRTNTLLARLAIDAVM